MILTEVGPFGAPIAYASIVGDARCHISIGRYIYLNGFLSKIDLRCLCKREHRDSYECNDPQVFQVLS